MTQRKKLYKHWYLLVLRGLLIILLGITAFAYPYEGKISFIRLFEIFALASGLLMIQSAIMNRHHSYWRWLFLNGLLDFSFGLLLWLVPEISSISVPLVIGFWFLYSGIIQGTESLVLIHDNVRNWWFELISGVMSFIMAFVLIAQRVRDTDSLLALVGVLALIYGAYTILAVLFIYEPDSE